MYRAFSTVIPFPATLDYLHHHRLSNMKHSYAAPTLCNRSTRTRGPSICHTRQNNIPKSSLTNKRPYYISLDFSFHFFLLLCYIIHHARRKMMNFVVKNWSIFLLILPLTNLFLDCGFRSYVQQLFPIFYFKMCNYLKPLIRCMTNSDA